MSRVQVEHHPENDAAVEADDLEVARVTYTLFIMLVAVVAPADTAAYFFLPLPETVREVLFIGDSFCAVILLVDAIARLIWSPHKLRFLLPWGLLDLLGSVPTLPFLRFLWLPHLIQTGRRLRRTTPAEVRLQARRRLAESTLLVVGAVMLVLVTACSIAVVLVEAGAPKANIVTGGDAVWWAIVTIATVGYGDYYPVTHWGRVFGVVLMVGGVTLFSTLTSFIAASFVRGDRASAGELAALRRDVAALRHVDVAPAAPMPAVEPPRNPS